MEHFGFGLLVKSSEKIRKLRVGIPEATNDELVARRVRPYLYLGSSHCCISLHARAVS